MDWLRNKPDGADLDEHHFAVLDRRAAIDCSVVTCKIGDKHLKGDALDCYRWPARFASAWLVGLEAGQWEELKENAKNPKKSAEIDYGDRK